MIVLRESARVRGRESHLHLLAKFLFPRLKFRDFLAGQLRQFAVLRFGFQQFGVLRQIIHRLEVTFADVRLLLEA